VEFGQLEICNNLIENSMRLVAVARKAFLFAGSEEGAERAAQSFSLVESCRRPGINANEYLIDVLERLPRTSPQEYETLTPRELKAAREAHAVAN